MTTAFDVSNVGAKPGGVATARASTPSRGADFAARISSTLVALVPSVAAMIGAFALGGRIFAGRGRGGVR
eukprot:5634781-Alexandrium_andersonii.AAC.1